MRTELTRRRSAGTSESCRPPSTSEARFTHKGGSTRQARPPAGGLYICPLTCGFGARGGIRTLDLPITSRNAFVQQVPPRRFWQLRSAGSSSQCVPDLSCYGRGNDQENDCETAGGSVMIPGWNWWRRV